jgi:hypothetical protein
MKTITISAKCSDLCWMKLSDGGEHCGYVPSWFPNPQTEHFGDYVQLTIDLETGQILNWKRPTQAQLKETFNAFSGE